MSFFTSTWEGIATKTPTNTLHPQLPRQEPQLPGTRHRRQHSHTYQRRQRECPEWAWSSSYLPRGVWRFQRLSSCVFFRLFMKTWWNSLSEDLALNFCWKLRNLLLKSVASEKRKLTQQIIIWDDLKTYLSIHFLKSHPTMSPSFTTVAIHLPRRIALCKSFGKCPGCLGSEKLMIFSPTDNADETSTIFERNGGKIQIAKFASLSM